MHEAVGVVGAGAMGSGIAHVTAAAGHPVFLVDLVDGAAAAGRDRIGTALARDASKGRIDSGTAAETLARIHVVEDVGALPSCAVIVEAIREDLGDKQDLFAELDRRQPADALLATNTSSLDVSAIASATRRPDRVIGLHFFNPPAAMRLVEVVRADHSSDEAITRGTAYVRAWGKSPVACRSTPGFIVNRVARPFYGEAQRLLQDGVADAATIDAALRGAGFRMGPLELTDLIGQDVNLAVGTSVWEQTGRDPRYEPTRLQVELVQRGQLGRKSGQGIFRYAADGGLVAEAPDHERLAELIGGPIETDPVARTLAMLVNEAVDLVHRGEASSEDVDLAMTLGTNYPRGPIEWGREIGFGVVRGHLERLDAAYPGGRYRPSPAL